MNEESDLLMTAQVQLDKHYILQAVLRLLERGLSTKGVMIVLSHNCHYVLGDVIDVDLWEEMGFFVGAKPNELILNLPAVEDLRKGTVDIGELKSGSYPWQLVDHYKKIPILWQ